ncbi:TlpA family protein disulfide reductase [Parapedobacter sp.]
MKRKLHTGEGYALSNHKLKQFKIRYISLLAVLTSMCLYAVKQVSAQVAEPAATAKAQAATDLVSTGLPIGSKLPDYTIDRIHNFHSSKAKLDDFNGKLLILDFWATWCGPCLAMMPVMDSLQTQFGGQIQFLSVSYQSEKEIKDFLNKYEDRKGFRPETPWVGNDTTLRRFFPHKTLPHYVWIDPEGTVRAITDNDAVNASNIRAALKEDFPNKKKKDYVLAYDDDQPFLLDGNGGDGHNLIYHSVLTGYTEGLSAGLTIDKLDTAKSRKIFMRNKDLLSLFSIACREDGHFGRNRTRLLVSDTSKFVWDEQSCTDYLDWKREGNGYCYELIVPPAAAANIYSYMREDMRRLFPQYRFSLPEKEVTCYALVRQGVPTESFESNGGKPEIKADRFACRIRNAYLSSWIHQLNVFYLQKSPWPIIDDTGITYPVDLDINASLSDIEQMNKELAKYGLKFVKTTRRLKVLEIEDQSQTK